MVHLRQHGVSWSLSHRASKPGPVLVSTEIAQSTALVGQKKKKKTMATSPNVTALLDDRSRGNRSALNQLLPLVYAELRRIAARQLRKERNGHTLQATALVHEVYLRRV